MEMSQAECFQNTHDAENGQPEDLQWKSVQKRHDAKNEHPEKVQQ